MKLDLVLLAPSFHVHSILPQQRDLLLTLSTLCNDACVQMTAYADFRLQHDSCEGI